MDNKKKVPQVVITIEGGMVQSVLADQDVVVFTIDYDTQDEENVRMIPQGEGYDPEPAYVDAPEVQVSAEEIEKVLEVICGE